MDYRGRRTLRDLVENTNCYWVMASEMTAGASYWGKILASLDRVNFYLPMSYGFEAKRIAVCQTEGDLIQVPTEDADGLTIMEIKVPSGTKQVAIRLNDEIYLDMKEFRRLDPDMQAYLLLHELTHSFISIKEERRNMKLRSFVASVRRNELTPMTVAEFKLQVERNGLDVASDPIALTPYRQALTRFFSDQSSDLERTGSAFVLHPIEGKLRSAHRVVFAKLRTDGRKALSQAIKKSDYDSIEKLIGVGVDQRFGMASNHFKYIGKCPDDEVIGEQKGQPLTGLLCHQYFAWLVVTDVQGNYVYRAAVSSLEDEWFEDGNPTGEYNDSTPLHVAVLQGDERMIDLLLQGSGIDFSEMVYGKYLGPKKVWDERIPSGSRDGNGISIAQLARARGMTASAEKIHAAMTK